MRISHIHKILAIGFTFTWLASCSGKPAPGNLTLEFPTRLTPSPASQTIEPTPSSEASLDQRPEEVLPNPLQTPPDQVAGLVTIWHSWDEEASKLLLEIVRSYQKLYPKVTFDLLYLPKTELIERYSSEAYQGGGPTLLLGPAEWGGRLFDQELVEDLSPFISTAFREAISSPALAAGSYHGAIFGIPYAQNGVLLYRNQSLISKAPESFDDLVTLSKEATRGGVIGAYLDRGSFFSLANLIGLGGQLIDDQGNPAFNQDNYQASLQWMKLLADFSQAGAAEVNGVQHLVLFKQGKVGFIIDGSWRLNELADAIGAENLAVDAWPKVDGGKMAGFVQSEMIYLNPAIKENPENYSAALSFIGYMLTPQVQRSIEDAGFFPVRQDIQGNSPLVQQIVLAFESGIPYPPILQGEIRSTYFDTVDASLIDVFERNKDPLAALQSAYNAIQQRLVEIRGSTP